MALAGFSAALLPVGISGKNGNHLPSPRDSNGQWLQCSNGQITKDLRACPEEKATIIPLCRDGKIEGQEISFLIFHKCQGHATPVDFSRSAAIGQNGPK